MSSFFATFLLIAPLLEDFEEAVLKYEKLMEDIKSLPRSFSFGWINVDLGPAREALANAAQHWRFMFVNHLEQDVIQSLADLAKFCEETSAGLQQPVVRWGFSCISLSLSLHVTLITGNIRLCCVHICS